MTISKEIIEVLDYVGNKFGIAIDWTSENAVPYIQSLCEKYIAWETATSIALLILGIVIAISGLLILKADWYGMQWIIMFFMITIAAPLIIVQIGDIIKCNTFPEMKIIEFIQMKMQ